MRPETDPWWRQAQADLDTAKVTDAAARHYATSWFAQQAVEKGLKALFIEQQGALAPKTHDIEYLGLEVRAPANVLVDLALLNPAFDQVRYPDLSGTTAPVDDITQALAAQHLAAAERILTWISALLP